MANTKTEKKRIRKLTINFFRKSLVIIEKNGIHQFEGFERYLNLIYDFMIN